MNDDRTIWLVRATDPGFERFEKHSVVALNCLITEDVAALRPEEIVARGPSKAHARELARIHDVAMGDVVLATDSHHPEVVLVGMVLDIYDHQPGLIDNHPHTFCTAWSGRLPRAALRRYGVLRNRSPKALGVWDAPAGARDVVIRAAVGEFPPTATTTTRRSSSAQRAPRPTWRVGDGANGVELLASVPRRSTSRVSWMDEQLAREERIAPCPIDRCDDHTKHRYWLDLAPPQSFGGGPNVVIVGINPTCPDVPHPRNTTFQQARRLARSVGAASCALVNLASRRTANQDELLMMSDGEIVGPRQEEMLARALGQADLVVLAYGRLPGPVGALLRPEHERLMAMLTAERRNGLVVAQVTDFPRHPRSWTAVAGGDDVLTGALCAA